MSTSAVLTFYCRKAYLHFEGQKRKERNDPPAWVALQQDHQRGQPCLEKEWCNRQQKIQAALDVHNSKDWPVFHFTITNIHACGLEQLPYCKQHMVFTTDSYHFCPVADYWLIPRESDNGNPSHILWFRPSSAPESGLAPKSNFMR